MSQTAEITDIDAARLVPVRMVQGNRMVVRAAQRLIGASLTVAALGIWIAPGAGWESDVMLFKLVLSVTALLAGLGFMQVSSSPAHPKVEIDPIRREVRLVRLERDGSVQVLQSCAFRDLTGAEQRGAHVRLWDEAGDLLAEVTLTNRKALARLIAGLRDAGKLA